MPNTKNTPSETLELVKTLVQNNASGLSTSELAESTGIEKGRIAAAIRKLKESGAIFQGGERRFARYGKSPAHAEQASLKAKQDAKSAKPKSVQKKRKSAAKKKKSAKKKPTNDAAAPPSDPVVATLQKLSQDAGLAVVRINESAALTEEISALFAQLEPSTFRAALASAFIDALQPASRRMGVAISSIAAMKADAPQS